MDALSLRLANLLVGNDEWAAALEITLMGPQLLVEHDLTVALTGADLSASIPVLTATRIAKGTVLRFGARRTHTRAYLAIRGGIETPVVLGSRATALTARLPGLAGRAVRVGDTLPIGEPKRNPPCLHGNIVESPDDAGEPVRFIWGPDRDRFSNEAASAFLEATFTLSADSNRMGYRLQGAAIPVREGGQVLSEASPTGSIQVPPSGEPIVLMADRQTAGGYARIGTVITADLHRVGQLGPGDEVRFQACDREEALARLRKQEQFLQQVRATA
jgi:biotin-dependent carboxylase-like uncharacterized protein